MTSPPARLRRVAPVDEEGPEPRGRPVYTIEEAADELRCSDRHVRRLYKTGKLPAKKCGGRVLILGRDLWAYIEALPSATIPR